MSTVIDIDLVRQKRALTGWHADCERRMKHKYPAIKFDADHWPIKTLYKTTQSDWIFSSAFVPFESKDRSFRDALRCLVAEIVIKESPKIIEAPARAFRLLAELELKSIFDITPNYLTMAEDVCLIKARKNPASADVMHTSLQLLKKQLELLADKGVVPRFGYHIRNVVSAELRKIAKGHRERFKAEKASILDRRIEAFNDALNALYENDPRLSAQDRVAIALTTRLMCAPSRINEVLCSSIDDHVTVEDYAQKPSGGELDVIHRTHQILLITMKGSKGPSWGAKPALNFMIDAFNYTTEVIKQAGQRSRMLVKWYQQHPNTLYLPQELEYLRGKDLSARDLAKIIYMTETPSENAYASVKDHYCKKLLRHFKFTGRHHDTQRMTVLRPFKDVERLLLEKVRLAMAQCHKVTTHNHYEGDLSKMLVLVDREFSPYLPWAISYDIVHIRLNGATNTKEPSLFQKLGITMPANGKMECACIETHDPRRWLTTQAELHGEKLSDVLINKWSNRLKLAQLKAYDMRSPEELAAFCRMPAIDALDDISRGIEQANKLEEEYGLKSEIVTVPDANISLTSMDLVLHAIEDRPVARTSEQIIILYPSQFGVCLHQHHETPCRNYDSCLPCDSNVVVKGHMPSNDRIRNRSELLFKSIIRQVDKLVVVHNRGIADEPEFLEQHMLLLVEKGLDTVQMANYLIDEFHEIKDLIKDKLLIKRLEEAFVARGIVKQLDDKVNPAGTLMKYHNPSYHAAPGLEKALDSHGGREQILNDEKKLIIKYPQFAAKALNLKDERHLLTANGDDFED